jgi:hypothetical protein
MNNNMHFEDLTRVSHRFRTTMPTLAQDIRVLRRENELLKLEAYHLGLPTLQECMHEFNFEQNIGCQCPDCDVTDRVTENFEDQVPEDAVHNGTCVLRPKWEKFLRTFGVYIAWIHDEQPWLDNAHGDVDADVYCHVNGNWLRAGWGRKITSLDDPRKETWDRIVLDCSDEGMYEAESGSSPPTGFFEDDSEDD